MSLPVDVAALATELARFGDVAFLVTAPPGGRPHVVSVRVVLVDGVLTMTAGRTSRANATAAPAVALCWPGAPGAEHCLLVDGEATVDAVAETVVVRPTGAILHRLADASPDAPSCVPVERAE